jgi:PAS domain S-box-containing protein
VTTSENPAANGAGKPPQRRDASGPEPIDRRLRQIHEAAHEFGVFTLDRSGRVATWNVLAEQVCGYGAEEILGRDFSCLYTATEAADGQPARALARTVAQGRFEEQGTRRRRDGTSYWAAVVLTAVRDAAENHCGFACIMRDISTGGSTQQELQSRLRQQEAITKFGASSLEGSSVGELMTQATMISTAGLKADVTGVMQIDADGYNLTLAAISLPNPAPFVGMKMEGGRQSLSGYTLFSNEPVISEDLLDEPRFQPHPALIAYGVRSGISVAIKSRGAALGAVAAFTRIPRTFSHDDINFVQAIANILATAMERAATEERLRNSEEFLRTVIESSSDVIAVLDCESKIRFVSGSGEVWFGRKMAQLVGIKGSDFAHPDDIPIRQRIFDAALAHPDITHSAEIRVRVANGTYLDCDVGMRGLTDIGGAPGVLVNIRDISARKRAEVELAGARDAALESSRLKSAFLANMSHEFRTPLNIILGYNELIGEHLAETRDSSQVESVEAVARACKRLLQTLNAVLDYSKLESRSFPVNPLRIKPVPLIRGLIAELMPQVSKKGLTLAFAFDDETVTVAFDEYCLTEALRNLLENAIKFTEHGSATVGLTRDESGGICLNVTDTGIGIDAAYQAHLLEPFSQEDCGMSRRFEGAGLGLALTRRYLELNGATLSVRSEKGAGSTFTIHFRRIASALGFPDSSTSVTPPVPLPQPSAIAPMVMVVEDDLDNQILMRAMMKNRYRMLAAASAAAVYRQIQDYPETIDIILMDLGLRGPEDGLTLTRSLRTLERFRTTPIIALTGHALSVNHDQALMAGCDDFIIKPFNRAELFATIERLLQRSSELAIVQHAAAG